MHRAGCHIATPVTKVGINTRSILCGGLSQLLFIPDHIYFRNASKKIMMNCIDYEKDSKKEGSGNLPDPNTEGARGH